MCDTWVVDASPLILYARIDQLNLLSDLSSRIIVPSIVMTEVQKGLPRDECAKSAIDWATTYRRENIPVPDSVEHWDLGPGETQVISFCLQHDCFAILDDRMARRCVKAHGLKMTGSLGVILMARKQGLISSARPWVYKLINQGQ